MHTYDGMETSKDEKQDREGQRSEHSMLKRVLREVRTEKITSLPAKTRCR